MQVQDIQRAVVVGAGTMGAGIAGELARAGRQVALVDTSPALLEQGLQRIAAAQRSLQDAGLLTAAAAAAATARIHTDPSLQTACADVDLAIEAVTEDLAVKRPLFAELHQWCPAHAVLATNTSGLSITSIAAACGRPTLVAGLHFWNPPHVIPLVEVTRGQQTAPETTAVLVELVRALDKQPVLVRHDVPGFVGNRLQFAVFREALHLLAAGIATAEDIDTAMTAGPGLRYGLLGPLRTADLGGLDVFAAISGYLFSELSQATGPPPLLGELVRQGRLGAKSGTGFYEYQAEECERLLQRRDRVLLEFVKQLRGS